MLSQFLNYGAIVKGKIFPHHKIKKKKKSVGGVYLSRIKIRDKCHYLEDNKMSGKEMLGKNQPILQF